MINEDSIVFDIETGVNSKAKDFMPEFEADGRLTDPIKMAASVENKKNAWLEKCALDPVTGQILCIGYHIPKAKNPLFIEGIRDERSIDGSPDVFLVPNETALLVGFWHYYTSRKGEYMVGWNIHGFDMWFIYQRSLINGIKPPINPLDRNWQMTIDLMERWNCFDKRKMSALDEVAKALGLGHKTEGGEVSKNFGFFWKENRTLAITSCLNDVDLTRQIMNKIL